MPFSTSLRNHFVFPNFSFPNHLYCSKVLNKVLINGFSYDDITAFGKQRTNSIRQLSHPGVSSFVQYDLRSDVWGPEEILVLGKLDGIDLDMIICYGCRESREWDDVVYFLENHVNVNCLDNKAGNRSYQFRFPKEYSDTRLVTINVVREHEQSVKVSLMLKY